MATPRELLAEDRPVKRTQTHQDSAETTTTKPKAKTGRKPPLGLHEERKRKGPGKPFTSRLEEIHRHKPGRKKMVKEMETYLQPLSRMQRQFVLSYMEHGNGTKAALEAGYSPRSAHAAGTSLLNTPSVIIALSYEQQRLLERTDLTAGWVIARLRMESLYTGPGSTQAARVRALELLAKHLGIITDRKEVTATINSTHLQGVITLDCSKLSPEECDRLLQQQAPALDPNTLLALPQSQVVSQAIQEAITADDTYSDDTEAEQSAE